MSDSPRRIYLRKVKDATGSWTRRWQDLWRSDSGDVEYVRSDILKAEVAELRQKAEKFDFCEKLAEHTPNDQRTIKDFAAFLALLEANMTSMAELKAEVAELRQTLRTYDEVNDPLTIPIR